MLIKQKKREETDPVFQWKLNHIFESDDLWAQEFENVSQAIPDISQYKGTLGHSADSLYRCLMEQDRLSAAAERVYVYAHMKSHEDSGLSFYQSMADKADSLLTKLMAALSFVNPEILEIDQELLKEFQAQKPELALYDHAIQDLLRQKDHILSAEMEELLAQAHEIGQGPENIFAMLNNADLKFGTLINEKGQEQELTHGNFISMMESGNRDVRKNAFQLCYQAYLKQKNTLGSLYNASVKKDNFFSGQRRFASALEASLSTHNIPDAVYSNLIATVHSRLPLMHRYVELRKEKLNLPELHMYDLYTPLVPDINTSVTYENARETVRKALAVMGEDYMKIVDEAFANGWIDVYENEGKRSGGYAWGAYGTHPYILLNFDNKINDMFTLAHEVGHAVHSYYSNKTQPYVYSNYSIFVAEVASTVNEALLLDYLLKTTTDKPMRAYLINYYLEQFRGTLFRQTMFAEFELLTHQKAAAGEPLTADSLCEQYRELNRQYYGDNIILDDEIRIEWARIPHFYHAFYVYQYSTGYSAAIALSKKILEEGAPAVEAYKEFLKSGSKDYPIALLKKAGVDLSEPRPVELAIDVFAELIDEMRSIRL